eukprot:IDg10311t1
MNHTFTVPHTRENGTRARCAPRTWMHWANVRTPSWPDGFCASADVTAYLDFLQLSLAESYANNNRRFSETFTATVFGYGQPTAATADNSHTDTADATVESIAAPATTTGTVQGCVKIDVSVLPTTLPKKSRLRRKLSHVMSRLTKLIVNVGVALLTFCFRQ